MKKKFQVFVSSTYEDLKEERKAVLESLLKSHFIPAGMEYFNASNRQSWDIITKDIDESDYYVLIVAGKYGSLVQGETPEISYTEKEYNYACSIGKPILAFVYRDVSNLQVSKYEKAKKARNRLNSFRQRIQNEGRNVDFWEDKSDLVLKIQQSLSSASSDYSLSGWVRYSETLEGSDDQLYSKAKGLIREWKMDQIFRTRAEKNAESDALLEGHNIKQLDGIAFGLRSFRNTRERDVLACLNNGTSIRLLVMDPESAFAKQRALEENDNPDSIANSILELTIWAQKLNKLSSNGKISIKYYNAMPLDFYWRIDDVLYTGPYWFGTASQQTVTYRFSKGGRGFSLYSNYFDDLWNNTTLTRNP